jgi:VWFA-related protein
MDSRGSRGLLASAVFTALFCTALATAQTASSPKTAQVKPTFSVQVALVTTDVLVRDRDDHFVADLSKDDFEIYEDGVKQEIATMTLVHGGRVTNVLAPPSPPAPEGVLLPAVRPTSDNSGRVFFFFVDDLHLGALNTASVRDLFKQIQKTLLHDGDMFAMVSSGPSSLHIDLTYDRKRFEDAINQITGHGLRPSEIVQSQTGADGPAEVRYRTQVALSTVRGALAGLDQIHNRRKAFIYVSEGYDLIPFAKSRACDPSAAFGSSFTQNDVACLQNMVAQQTDSSIPQGQPLTPASIRAMGEEFADAELSRQLIELTKDANRANATFYAIDPRGLMGPLSNAGDNVASREWRTFVTKAQTSLRVLAEETGGIALVNTNDFDKGLKRIDAETSDYYVLGFYSQNPDPMKRTRKMEVKVARPGLAVWSRKELVLRPPSAAATPQP